MRAIAGRGFVRLECVGVSPKGGRKPAFFVDGTLNDTKKQNLTEIERIAREIAADLGLEIVELVFHSQGRHSLLRIDIDRPGMPGVGLADCEAMSRALDDRVEQIPFFSAPFDLQVSSPGIDRPIRTDDDLRRNAGRPVMAEFKDDTGKIREFRGTLAEAAPDGNVKIVADDSEVLIARERIQLMRQDVAPGGRHRKGP